MFFKKLKIFYQLILPQVYYFEILIKNIFINCIYI